MTWLPSTCLTILEAQPSTGIIVPLLIGLSNTPPTRIPSFSPSRFRKGPQRTSGAAGAGRTPRTMTHLLSSAAVFCSCESILLVPKSPFTATSLSPACTQWSGLSSFQRRSGPENSVPVTSMVSLPSGAGLSWHPHLSSPLERARGSSATQTRSCGIGLLSSIWSEALLPSSCIMASLRLTPFTAATTSPSQISGACHQVGPSRPSPWARLLCAATSPSGATRTTRSAWPPLACTSSIPSFCLGSFSMESLTVDSIRFRVDAILPSKLFGSIACRVMCFSMRMIMKAMPSTGTAMKATVSPMLA
mmetsp:Transcript_26661/g.75293  ORF Transcript_26661/g.75293 Transcript_26661/m.75293 type:complete len:304 (-) Transcript_26661:419-1330(-)